MAEANWLDAPYRPTERDRDGVTKLAQKTSFQLWQPKNVVLCMLLIVCFAAMVVGSMFLENTSIWLKRDQSTGRMVMGANSRLIEVVLEEYPRKD